MASTIQQIETPKRARALDTSSGWQVVSPELIASNAANNRTFDSGVGDWIVYDGDHPDDTAIANASNKLQVTTTVDDADEGAQLPIAHVGDGSTTSIVAGRSYRVSMDLDLTTPGSGTFAMRMTFAGDTSSSFDITTTETTYTKDFVAQNNTGGLFIYNTSSTNTVFTVDNVSVKEIRHFPNNNHGQIYSGRALEFDGVTDYLEIDPSVSSDSHTWWREAAGNYNTVACWINIKSYGNNVVWFTDNDVVSGSNNQDSRISLILADTGKVSFTTWNGSGYTHVSPTNAEILNLNTWYRIVCVVDNGTKKLYINGIQQTGSANALTGGAGPLAGSQKGAVRISYPTTNASAYFNGMISDWQAWDGAWTADDVTHDYLNPESLALNRGGTSLTNSNLKLWYPMQDGHRGQQSYILDASNTGLGDEIITDGGFDVDLSNWTLVNVTGANTVTLVDGTAKITYDNSVATSSLGMQYPNAFVAGTTYKLTMDVVSIVGSGVKITDGTTSFYTGIQTGSHTFYFTAGGTTLNILRSSQGSASTTTIDNISVKPVNDKNNATTVFFGDDSLGDYLTSTQTTALVDNFSGNTMVFGDAVTDGCDGALGSEIISTTADREFSSATNWSTTNTSITSGVLRRSGADGSASGIAQHTGTGNAVAGRWYMIQYTVSNGDRDAGGSADSSPILAQFGGMEAFRSGTSTSDPDGVNARIVYAQDTGKLKFTFGKNCDADIDDVSVKEVDGWISRIDASNSGAAKANTFSIDGTHGMGFANNGTIHGEILIPIKTVAGRYYRVKADCTVGAIKLGLSNTMLVSDDQTVSYGSVINSGNTGYSNIYQSNGYQAIHVVNNVNSPGGVVRFDNLTVQEVGVASGWTDADQQLYISQTALQSYNELAWFEDRNNVFDAAGATQNTHVNVTDNAVHDPETGDFTASAWVFQSTNDDDNYFFHKGGGGGYGWHMRVATDNDLSLNVRDTSNNTVTATSSGGPVTNGKWHHCVMTVDRTGNKLNGYVDGEKVIDGQSISSVTGTITGSDLEMGSWTEDYAGGVMNGSVTECSIFKGVCFSQAEINELYNDGKALDATTHSQVANLKGYWRNDGLNTTWKNIVSANSLNSQSPGDHDATLINGLNTMLIPQGLDSRDSQGFIMNRRRNTSSLNLPVNNDTADHTGPGMEARYTRDGVVDSQFGDGLRDFTIEFWFKTNQVLSSSGSVLYQSAGYSAPNWSGIDISLSYAGKIQVNFYTGSGSTSVVWGDSDEHGSVDYNDGDWHHVVFVVDRSTSATLIIDKVVKDIVTGTTITNHTSVVCFNGSQRVGSSTSAFQTGATTNRPAFDGQIDGLKIYNDLLTFDTDGSIAEGETVASGEVLRNYNATKGSHRN